MPSNRSSGSLSSSNSSMRSPKERKDCLKRALEQTLILQEAISGSTIIKLDQAISEVDNVTSETSIHDKISNQQEVLIDSQMMISSSKVIKTCAISLTNRMRNYDHIDFAQKVVKYLQEMSQDDEQPVNWSLLETRVTKLFKRIPDFSTLLGILEPLEKKQVNRKKPEKRIVQQATMKVPDKIVSQTESTDDSVDKTMRKIRKLIIDHCKDTQEPLDLFQLIIHPQDFGKTIRNLLYVSFLIKDGVLKLSIVHQGGVILIWERRNQINPHDSNPETKLNINTHCGSLKSQIIILDNDGKPVVQPCRKSQQDGQSSNKIGAQAIISLNMKQWIVLKNMYKVKKPMIDFDEGN